MERITGALLLAVFAATQSGWVNYLHRCDYLACGHRAYASPSLFPPCVNGHDEATCRVCTTLHMPLSAGGYAPLLIFLGLAVAFLSLITPKPVVRRVCVWIEGRGPPMS